MQVVLQAHIHRAVRLPDQQVRRADRRRGQQMLQISDDLRARSGPGTRIAKTQASPIIRTRTRQLGDLRLDQRPIAGWISYADVKHYRRAALADAHEVELASGLDFNQPLRFGVDAKLCAIARASSCDLAERECCYAIAKATRNSLHGESDVQPR